VEKSIEKWEIAFRHLKEILVVSVETNYRDENVYPFLKMSYNYLESKAKLFLEDQEILTEDVTRC
jgi:hypothetical protein